MKEKIGILVHGRHVETKGWENLVWGKPPNKLGSLTKMVHIAIKEGIENIALVVFGTGASERDGIKEAECMKQYLLKHFEDLIQFSQIAEHFTSATGLSSKLKNLVERIIPEIDSKNTLEELRNAAELFLQAGVNRIIQISCGSHLPRCIQNRLQLEEDGMIPENQTWYAVADDMTFSGSSAKDVIILEPPHRGDDPMMKQPKNLLPNMLARRMFKLSLSQRLEFLKKWDTLLTSYGA